MGWTWGRSALRYLGSQVLVVEIAKAKTVEKPRQTLFSSYTRHLPQAYSKVNVIKDIPRTSFLVLKLASNDYIALSSTILR